MGDAIYYELSDDEIFKQISECSSKDFYVWNSTSLRSLFVACSGYNGNKVRQQGVNLLLDYRSWYRYNYVMRTPPWLFYSWLCREDSEALVFLNETIDFVLNNSIQQGGIQDLRKFQIRFGKMDAFSKIF